MVVCIEHSTPLGGMQIGSSKPKKKEKRVVCGPLVAKKNARRTFKARRELIKIADGKINSTI
jgi:hypothetical protein